MALGLFAAWGATSYSGASGVYPMVLGLLLALTGGVVALKAIRASSDVERSLIDAPFKLFVAIALGLLYVALVVPVGFYTASFLLMLVMPFALGFQRPIYALTVGAVFIGIAYIIFSVLLKKPLPREAILSVLGSGG